MLRLLSGGVVGVVMLAAAPGAAGQTATPPSQPKAHHTTHKTKHGVPVVSPHHAGKTRTPSHPATPVVQPPAPQAAKPAPKPAKPARPVVPPDVGTSTGMHLPRYASLKTDEVNMRAGPAPRFPILWTYKRRELPVKIEREFDVWRLVEDMDGIKGWVHQATLTGKRTFVITGTEPRTLRADASATADPVAILKPGVVGLIKRCDAGVEWCQVQAGGYRGWLARDQFWGMSSGEVVGP